MTPQSFVGQMRKMKEPVVFDVGGTLMAITAIHPGEHLAEELEALGMSAAELAVGDTFIVLMSEITTSFSDIVR